MLDFDGWAAVPNSWGNREPGVFPIWASDLDPADSIRRIHERPVLLRDDFSIGEFDLDLTWFRIWVEGVGWASSMGGNFHRMPLKGWRVCLTYMWQMRSCRIWGTFLG